MASVLKLSGGVMGSCFMVSRSKSSCIHLIKLDARLGAFRAIRFTIVLVL